VCCSVLQCVAVVVYQGKGTRRKAVAKKGARKAIIKQMKEEIALIGRHF